MLCNTNQNFIYIPKSKYVQFWMIKEWTNGYYNPFAIVNILKKQTVISILSSPFNTCTLPVHWATASNTSLQEVSSWRILQPIVLSTRLAVSPDTCHTTQTRTNTWCIPTYRKRTGRLFSAPHFSLKGGHFCALEEQPDIWQCHEEMLLISSGCTGEKCIAVICGCGALSQGATWC